MHGHTIVKFRRNIFLTTVKSDPNPKERKRLVDILGATVEVILNLQYGKIWGEGVGGVAQNYRMCAMQGFPPRCKQDILHLPGC
jgi:hypothetical protein